MTTPLMHRHNPALTQQYIEVEDEEKKKSLLVDLIKTDKESPIEKTLIFVQTPQTAQELQRLLESHGQRVFALHKEIPEEERDAVLRLHTGVGQAQRYGRMKAEHIEINSATDVLS